MKDAKLWRFIADTLGRGIPLVLMVVAEHTTGSPGRKGFKMVVTHHNQRAGTVGGGPMEFKLVQIAEKMLRDGVDELWLAQHHNRTAPHDRSGMICAGSQVVGFFRVHPGRAEEMRGIAESLKKGERVALNLGQERVHEALLGPEFYMHIVGAGHVGLALSRVMSTLDCSITLFDHRDDLDTLHENTFAHKLVIGPYEGMGEHLKEGPAAYAAIVSTSFKTDAAALQGLLSKDLCYLGVMGSLAKIEHLEGAMVEAGFSRELFRSRVRAPIGLPIGSHTTEEIAISIAAEIVQVKNAAPQAQEVARRPLRSLP